MSSHTLLFLFSDRPAHGAHALDRAQVPLPKEAVPRAGAAAEDRLRGTASGALESPRRNALPFGLVGGSNPSRCIAFVTRW